MRETGVQQLLDREGVSVETVTVVFDEENPRRNTLYPAPMAKIST